MKRFLLISDIHACVEDPSQPTAPSYVSSFAAPAYADLDPFAELEALIKSNSLAPDFILCPGDITNRSTPDSFKYAWEKLNKIATSCGVPIVATVGNHDVDSRYKTSEYDPRQFTMSLTPTIPVPDRSQFLEYWAENFTLVSAQDCNIIVLNTAAYHGSGKEPDKEIEHGRISDRTLSELKKKLEHLPKASVNLLLCHHHPIKAENTDKKLEGLTRGGESLVNLLSEASDGWIIVHGHKHVPDLFYGHGGANSPVILACASFSAQVNIDAQNKNPNQVHYLVCDPAEAIAGGWASVGNVLSWTWQPGIGWRKAQGPHGLSHIAGFGYRASVRTLVDQFEHHLNQTGAPQISWSDAIKAIPSLQRLVPIDFVAFEKFLKLRGFAILNERDGSLAQIGRRA